MVFYPDCLDPILEGPLYVACRQSQTAVVVRDTSDYQHRRYFGPNLYLCSGQGEVWGVV